MILGVALLLGGLGAEDPGLSHASETSTSALTHDLRRFHQRRLDIDRAAMLTLGTWALGNVGVGLWGDFIREDEGGSERFFHQMNWMWGAVNGVIAGIGLYAAYSASPENHDYLSSLNQARTTETIFLINGVLDLAYVGTGAWLWERGLRTQDRVLEGYGQSVMLQGTFLLLFDGVVYVLRRTLTDELEGLPVQLVPTYRGAMLRGHF